MVDINALEHQLIDESLRIVGPDPVVDDAAIFTAITATQSPKWRFGSMFSATKFVVAGAIVALFGGFVLSGVLTQQPSDDGLPAIGASASATAQAEPTEAATTEPEPTSQVEADDTTTPPDLLPRVELDTEEVAPGVYRVLGDGVRDITDRVRQVVFDSEGDVWVKLGTGKKNTSNVVRLGEPGVSLKLGKQGGELGTMADGALVVTRSDDVTRWFDGDAWRKRLTELSEYDRCWLEATAGWSWGRGSAVGADGACYTSHGGDDEPLVRIDADGTRTAFTRDELGLGPEQNWVDDPVVGPDGSIWADVGYTPNGMTGIFRGLVRYDGSAWSFIPYDGDDAELCGACSPGLAIDRDGVVWVGRSVRVADAPPVLSWDGESWGSYLQGEVRLRLDGARAWPNGDIWFGSDVRWDGTTVSLAEPLLPWGELFLPTPRATAPDGSVWTVIDRQLYMVTSEAMMVAE